MGVPKFYRWISERYPCLSEVVREYQIPEFDNLYLDMNGIIHLCSHPNDDDPHFRITEEKIFTDICHYIECLFRLIKPRKVFFMAVDGVAPRAKMNQQRGRRFRSAREALELEKRAVQKGEVLPSEERFDSNCITPGTEFMARLHDQLKYFTNMKISTDRMWQGVHIYLSGHETPGEGEHKVMDFIRCEKSKPSYDPNTRHCLYGLDADLMMLGLCTHEPHFSLLREEVRFTNKKSQKRTPTPEETTFHLLHLSLMREYLEHEFSPLRTTLSFDFDVEKIIDDWVLMGFLVGNDFIPNLPNMHIAHGALPLLYKTYIEVLPGMDGYINEGGYLNLVRFEKYMKKLAEYDYEHFNESYTDFKWLESKRKCTEDGNVEVFRGKRLKTHIEQEKKKIARASHFPALEDIGDDDFQLVHENDDQVPTGKLIDYSDSDDTDNEDELLDSGDGNDEEDTFMMEFNQHKRDYYVTKLEYEQVTPEILRAQAECFVRAVQWNLHYYYNGVCSWSWYYPHHYAPFISDIKNFSHLKLEYDLDVPFLPFEQLLAVLPSASCKLLPKPFQALMCNSNSPLIDYYPAEFETDLNGKQQDWEAVVLIPFINEERLLKAMKSLYELLTDEEKRRNCHGPCLLYTYVADLQEPCPSLLPLKFPNVESNHAKCTLIPPNGFHVERSNLVKGLCQAVRLDVYFPGFPTLKHVPHKASLKKAEVKVFQMSSRGENMVLEIEKHKDVSLHGAAQSLLGQIVYVGWPHLTESLVTSVADSVAKCSVSKSAERWHEENITNLEAQHLTMTRNDIKERYFRRWGVDIKGIEILVFAKPLVGQKYICISSGQVILEKQWSLTESAYALQAVVKDITVQDSLFQQHVTIEELFPLKSCVFKLELPNYGLMGTVEKVHMKQDVTISVRFEVPHEPNLNQIVKKYMNAFNQYLPAYIVAQRLAISGRLLGCISGAFHVKMGSHDCPVNQTVNIGLSLKFNKKNVEVPGYTKKVDGVWLYSPKAIETIASYIARFPDLFDFLSLNLWKQWIYQAELSEVYPEENILNVIQGFLKGLPSYQLPQRHCGGELLDEQLVKVVEETCGNVTSKNVKCKFVQMEVSANMLYKPNNFRGSASPDKTATFHVFDRVVNVRDGFTVPLGVRGTIIGINIVENVADVVYDVLFDREFPGGLSIRGSKKRRYQMPPYALINLSHGLRLEQLQHHKPMAVVHPQAALLNDGQIGNTSRSKMTRSGRQNVTDVYKANSKPQGQYPNTINHSPNSPFIPRQTSAARPQFVTPRMPTTSTSRLTSRQVIHANAQHGPESDFESIWECLKIVKTAGQIRPSAEIEQNKSSTPMKGSLTLSQAAKTLPKHNSKQSRQRGLLKEPEESGSMQRQRQQPPMPNFSTKYKANVVENTEFAAMLQALGKVGNRERASKQQQPKTAEVAEITKLLRNISVTGAKGQDSSSNKSSSTGIRLTVDQLFDETRKHGEKVRELSNKAVPSRNQAQSVSLAKFKEERRETQTQNSNKESYVELVRNFFQQRFGSVPVYDYVNTSPDVVLAKVHLPNGSVCDGGRGKDRQEAAEHVAKIAYHHLVHSSDFVGQPPPTPLMGTTTKPMGPPVPFLVPQLMHVRLPAYHVQHQQLHQGAHQQRMATPYMFQNPYIPGPMGYVPHDMMQPYGQPPSIPSLLGNPWISMGDPAVGLQYRALPRSDNPFVPLQVTRQTMTPKKKNFESPVWRHAEQIAEKPLPTLVASGNSGSASATPRETKIATVTSSFSMSNKGDSKGSERHRRRRSRLAINFGAAPQ